EEEAGGGQRRRLHRAHGARPAGPGDPPRHRPPDQRRDRDPPGAGPRGEDQGDRDHGRRGRVAARRSRQHHAERRVQLLGRPGGGQGRDALGDPQDRALAAQRLAQDRAHEGVVREDGGARDAAHGAPEGDHGPAFRRGPRPQDADVRPGRGREPRRPDARDHERAVRGRRRAPGDRLRDVDRGRGALAGCGRRAQGKRPVRPRLEALHRDVRGARSADRAMIGDLRHALRVLAKRPAFTLVAVLTLGLGIGASTSVVSVVDAVLLRPYPHIETDRWAYLWETSEGAGLSELSASIPNFRDWKQESRSFADLVLWMPWGYNVSGPGSGDAERVEAAVITADVFTALGIRPAAGRLLLASDSPKDGVRPVFIS